jgi:hypothetical protein
LDRTIRGDDGTEQEMVARLEQMEFVEPAAKL